MTATHAGIHRTAVVDPKAEIGRNVTIGPFCVVAGNVTLHDGVTLHPHVAVTGRTTVGIDSTIFPFASVGQIPQDLKYAGEESALEIGARAIVREHVTINTGTEGGGMVTRIGDDCLFMATAHVAHDCQVGNHVILANNGTLGGHVLIEDHVVIGGFGAVHQFCRVGQHAMVGGMSAVVKDVIPYGTVLGQRAVLCGLNLIGLKRRNFAREDIHALRTAYRMLFAAEGTMEERLADVVEMFRDSVPVMHIVDHIRTSTRGICQPQHDTVETP